MRKAVYTEREWLGLMIYGRASALATQETESGDMAEIDPARMIDRRHVEENGIKYRVDIVLNDEARPEGDELLGGQFDVVAWHLGEWRYVDVIVTPLITGADEKHMSDKMAAVPCGRVPGFAAQAENLDVSFLVARYPVPEMIRNVRRNLRMLSGRLEDLGIRPHKHSSGEYKIVA